MAFSWDKLWYRKGIHPVSVPLMPLSALMGGGVWLRRQAYRRGWAESKTAAVPVVVVGNISVGGTGKTPFLIWLGQYLQAQGIRIGVVSRGYRAAEGEFPRWVGSSSSPELVGDEPYMMFQHLQCPMAVGPERSAAVAMISSRAEVDVILSDDGMQHYAMGRQLEIALVDGARGLGNALLLPAGPLREPASRLQEVDYVVANSLPYDNAPVMRLESGKVLSVADHSEVASLSSLAGQRVHGVAGIGNPARFFDMLTDLGLDVIPHAFPDHHAYTTNDLDFGDDFPVLMTEKDAVKCRHIGRDKLWYAPVSATLPKDFSAALLADIQRLITSK